MQSMCIYFMHQYLCFTTLSLALLCVCVSLCLSVYVSVCVHACVCVHVHACVCVSVCLRARALLTSPFTMDQSF